MLINIDQLFILATKKISRDDRNQNLVTSYLISD